MGGIKNAIGLVLLVVGVVASQVALEAGWAFDLGGQEVWLGLAGMFAVMVFFTKVASFIDNRLDNRYGNQNDSCKLKRK